MSAFEADRFNHSRTSPRQEAGTRFHSLYLNNSGIHPGRILIVTTLRAFRAKEAAQHLGALFLEHPARDLHLMIELRMI